jgi:hypothetical protein
MYYKKIQRTCIREFRDGKKNENLKLAKKIVIPTPKDCIYILISPIEMTHQRKTIITKIRKSGYYF